MVGACPDLSFEVFVLSFEFARTHHPFKKGHKELKTHNSKLHTSAFGLLTCWGQGGII